MKSEKDNLKLKKFFGCVTIMKNNVYEVSMEGNDELIHF